MPKIKGREKLSPEERQQRRDEYCQRHLEDKRTVTMMRALTSFMNRLPDGERKALYASAVAALAATLIASCFLVASINLFSVFDGDYA